MHRKCDRVDDVGMDIQVTISDQQSDAHEHCRRGKQNETNPDDHPAVCDCIRHLTRDIVWLSVRHDGFPAELEDLEQCEI